MFLLKLHQFIILKSFLSFLHFLVKLVGNKKKKKVEKVVVSFARHYYSKPVRALPGASPDLKSVVIQLR